MTIYEIGNDIHAFSDLVEEATTDQDGNPKEMDEESKKILAPMLAELERNYRAKAESILKYRANLLAMAGGCKAEEERLYKKRKAAENKAKALVWLLEESMRKIGEKKIEAGIFSVSLQKNPPSAYVFDKNILPGEFWRIEPEEKEPDKKAIIEALKAGAEVPGAMLSQSESLRVR